MAEGLVLFILAVVLFIVLGPLKVNNVRVNNAQRYNPNNYRFTTPGRNERQRQLNLKRKDEKSQALDPQAKEEVVLENFKEGKNATVIEDDEVEVVQHPELAQKIIQDVIFPPLLQPPFWILMKS
jgi:hypothetical protein